MYGFDLGDFLQVEDKLGNEVEWHIYHQLPLIRTNFQVDELSAMLLKSMQNWRDGRCETGALITPDLEVHLRRFCLKGAKVKET